MGITLSGLAGLAVPTHTVKTVRIIPQLGVSVQMPGADHQLTAGCNVSVAEPYRAIGLTHLHPLHYI